MNQEEQKELPLPDDPVEAFRALLAVSEIPEKDDNLLICFQGTTAIELTRDADKYVVGWQAPPPFELTLRVPTKLLLGDDPNAFATWIQLHMSLFVLNRGLTDDISDMFVYHRDTCALGPRLSTLHWRWGYMLEGCGLDYPWLKLSSRLLQVLMKCVQYRLNYRQLSDGKSENDKISDSGTSVTGSEIIGAREKVIQEKLCEKLERQWSMGLKTEDLIDELSSKSGFDAVRR